MTRRLGAASVIALVLAGCVAVQTPSPSASPTPAATSSPRPSASASAVSPTPTASPEPMLTLDPPPGADARVVAVSVSPQVAADGGGTITVTVANQSDSLIDELVLRWPTELAETLFLAPFTPSDERIRDGGPPLVQPWTKWVVGPGEQGEPDGTTSLGWGPIPAASTLEIPIVVTRVAPGPLAFDLQVLAGEDLLTLDSGEPAQLRVSIP